MLFFHFFLLVVFINFNAKAVLVKNKQPVDVYFFSRSPDSFSHDFFLHPYRLDEKWKKYVKGLLFRPFFSVDGKGEIYCSVCEERKSGSFYIKNKKPVLIFNYEIAKNLFWGDGVPVTADDILFSLEVAEKVMVSDNISTFNSFVHKISRDNDSKKKISIVLKKSLPINKLFEDFVFIPKHIEEKIWLSSNKDPLTYLEQTSYVKNPTLEGLYYGNYGLEQMNKGEVVLTKNQYNATKNNINSIRLIFSSSKLKENTFILENKKIIVPEVNEDINTFFSSFYRTKRNVNQLKIIKGGSCDYYHVSLNHKNPILLNSYVRKALYYSIDKLSMYKKVFDDVIPAVSFVPPGHHSFNEDINSYGYNPKKAEQILLEEGWHFDKKKDYRNKNNRILELSVLVNDSDLSQVQVARYISESWERVGIKIKMNKVKRKEFVKLLTTRNYSGAAIVSIDICQVENIKSLFSSKSIPNINNNYKGLNVSSWVNGNVEKSIYQLNYEQNLKVRNELLSRIQIEYSRDLPAIPLFFKKKCALVGQNITGYTMNSYKNFSSYDADNWRVLD